MHQLKCHHYQQKKKTTPVLIDNNILPSEFLHLITHEYFDLTKNYEAGLSKLTRKLYEYFGPDEISDAEVLALFEKLPQLSRLIWEFMRRYFDLNNRPPSVRDITAALNISSTSVTNYHINKLIQNGFAERTPSVARGTRAIIPGSSKMPDFIKQPVYISVSGRIVAGEPVQPSVDDDTKIEVPSDILDKYKLSELFALSVKGDSMDALVADGDAVILRSQNYASDGDTVAVLLKGRETTLKTYFRKGDKIILNPENSAYDPIEIHASECVIQGKVLRIIRNP